jgi:hypothetical protein
MYLDPRLLKADLGSRFIKADPGPCLLESEELNCINFNQRI